MTPPIDPDRRRAAGRALHAWFAVLTVSVFAGACADMPTSTPEHGAAAASLVAGSNPIVLIGFHAKPSAAELALVGAHGGKVVHEFTYVPIVAATLPLTRMELLAADPRVAFVEPEIPLIPMGGKQVTDWGVEKIEAEAAWALGFRGEGVKVGIFDSGIALDHPDLVVAGGIDLVNDGRGLHDCNGHGTHVAGIVGATNNGNHSVGVAPRAALYSMRLADCDWAGGTTTRLIQGIEWAITNGMDVVNMSFGFGIGAAGVGAPNPTSPSEAVDAAFDAAYAAGVVLVAASGNSLGPPAPTSGNLPYVTYPAAYPQVVAVGATDDEDRLSSFSQFGTAQELTAPGVNNLASFLVGQGQATELSVDSDEGRELAAVGMAFSGKTRKRRPLVAEAVAAGLGMPEDFLTVDCTGRIAVVSRGQFTFAEKAEAAMNAGCIGVVIHNHLPGNFAGTLGAPTTTDGRPWVPVVSVSQAEGVYLREQILDGTTVLRLVNEDGNLAVLSGTSMAAPHAAGVAALIRSKSRTLPPDEVRAILRQSAEDLGTPGWDPVFGYGRVNARRAVQLTP